jgi:hypothetical protein
VLTDIFQVDDLTIVEQLLDWNVDGIITDFATNVRLLVENTGRPVRPKFDEDRVNACLKQHLQLAPHAQSNVTDTNM